MPDLSRYSLIHDVPRPQIPLEIRPRKVQRLSEERSNANYHMRSRESGIRRTDHDNLIDLEISSDEEEVLPAPMSYGYDDSLMLRKNLRKGN